MSLPLILPTTIPLSKALLLDIEADGLPDSVTKIHCLCSSDWNTKECFNFRPDQLKEAYEFASSYPVWIVHNGIDYDKRVISKQLGKVTPIILDTLVLSRLLFPDRPGGHSLKAWGIRLGILKGELKLGQSEEDEDTEEDTEESVWSEFSEEMFEYCQQDVRVLDALMQHLLTKIKKWET